LVRLIKTVVTEPQLGLEIGVEEGRTTNVLLEEFPRLTLVGVDPWKAMNDDDPMAIWAQFFVDSSRSKTRQDRLRYLYKHVYRTQEEIDLFRRSARRVAKRHGRRCKLMQTDSQQAYKRLRHRKFDFVFIDGDHTQARQDVMRFWPLVRPGGILTGHDLGAALEKRGCWDTSLAVKLLESQGHTLLRENRMLWGFRKP
jgi:hypothetical protein